METKHTRGPYTCRQSSNTTDGEKDWGIFGQIGDPNEPIAEVFGRISEHIRPNAKATAHYICLACNSHAALLEALKDLLHQIGHAPEEWFSDECEGFNGNKARAAIALAEKDK